MEKTSFKSKLHVLEMAGYKILNLVISVFAGFILSRAGIKNLFSPFSSSFIAIAPMSGLSVICVYIGTVLGFAFNSFSVLNFKYICVNTIMLVLILVTGKKRYIRAVYSPILPGVVCLVGGFIFLFADEFSFYGVALLVCESLLCGCSAYFGNYFISSVKRKIRMDTRDLIAFNIALLILICALDTFYIYGFSLSLVFVIILIFCCAYFGEAKIAAVFTLSLCLVTAFLHSANNNFFLILYLPSLICIIVSKFDKKYIEVSYFLAYFTLVTAMYGLLKFNLTLLASPLIAAFVFRTIPKKRLVQPLSVYIDIPKEETDDSVSEARDDLCVKYRQSADNLIKEINDVNVIPIINTEFENKLRRFLYVNKCRDVSITNYYSSDGKQIVSVHFKSSAAPNIQLVKGKINELTKTNFTVCGEDRDENACVYKFEQADIFKVECFALYKAKRGENVCGDNILAFKSVGSTYNIILADGMGSGKEAYIKSNNTVTILKKLLKSGVSPQKAIETVNCSMEILKDEIGFSTIDLCNISLITGVANFYKCGAYNAYIVRNKKLIKINAGGYPAGLMSKITYSFSTVSLQDGDMIIFLSDGVSYAADKLQATMLLSTSRDPESLTRELLDCAYNDTPPEFDDDMTVLAAKVIKRRFE